MKNTIKSHQNFDFGNCKPCIMPALLMKFREKKFETGQYGLIASKRTFKLAVDRNRAKRLLRDWIQQNKLPKDFDILFIARSQILETAQKEGIVQMKKALRKIPA